MLMKRGTAKIASTAANTITTTSSTKVNPFGHAGPAGLASHGHVTLPRAALREERRMPAPAVMAAKTQGAVVAV